MFDVRHALFAAASVVAFHVSAQTETTVVGQGTRTLLELQRSGQRSGPELPMLGAASALSYQRYLDSHKHPIPVTLSSTVANGGNAAPGGSSR